MTKKNDRLCASTPFVMSCGILGSSGLRDMVVGDANRGSHKFQRVVISSRVVNGVAAGFVIWAAAALSDASNET